MGSRAGKMAFWKTPPKAKVYEALSAVADGRVTIVGDHMAEVSSSDQSKSYSVEWTKDVEGITSNDNASYWQGYLGYPILAVLMVLGRLSYDLDVAGWLAGIQWKQVNTRFKNDYDQAVEFVLSSLEDADAKRAMVADEIDRIYKQVEELRLVKLPRHKLPPK
jgi:hypothetical protein